MPRNSIITEGFTSLNSALITEGYADLQEITPPILEWLEITKPEKAEEFVKNYADIFTKSEFYAPVRGGRAATIVEPDQAYDELLGGKYKSIASSKREAPASTVSRIDFASKDKIKGTLRTEPPQVNRLDFASKDKIRGLPNTELGRTLREDFISKKKVKGKRTGRDGELNYEDDMFKK